jgi:hypothetical protein
MCNRIPKEKLTRAQAEQIMRSLADMGLVEDSGRRRNGQVVWVVTEYGLALGPNALDIVQTKH